MNSIRSKKNLGRLMIVIIIMMLLGIVGCKPVETPDDPEEPVLTPTLQPTELAPLMSYEVIAEYPHDPQAFTQGLIYWEGFFYESTGLYGESSLRKVSIETGEVLQAFSLPPEYFAEGLTLWENTLIQLTWRENKGFVYELADFTLLREFDYPTEGWGLTHDGEKLIMSDGSSTLFFLDPDGFQIVDQVMVTYQGQEVIRINELEYVQGEIFANIWQTDTLVRIDPLSGEVKGVIDLSGILPSTERSPETDVLNGIAYDPDTDRLFITGKFWPKVYEIRLVPVDTGED